MNEFIIHQTVDDILDSNDNYVACLAMLRANNLPYRVSVCKKGTLTRARGKVNPANGFVVATPEDEIIFDCIGLAKHIDSKGLALI